MPSLPETQALYSPAALAALVRDFDREPVGNRQRISDFLSHQPEVFYRAAIEILKKETGSRAAQHLLALLTSGELLFRALSDPALERERAAELARYAHAGNPAVGTRLARHLADAINANAAFAPGMAERVLEIISDFSEGKHLLPSLMRMLRSENPYLRSKAVLLIGRAARSLNWIKRRLQESDTRVRANAIEAIWGVDTVQARELLEWAARDGNNRVAGNALVGLYRLGETSALTSLLKMAGHDSPAFRRTAAWAMGQSGDPRYAEVLGRMITDVNGHVRKGAFEAVRRVRTAMGQVSQTGEWPVAAAPGPRDPRTGERRVSVAVAAYDGRESPRVLPVQFILAEEGQAVWSYRVVEKMAPGPLTVLFLFPRNLEKHWNEFSLRCLAWKRSTDLWSAVPYAGCEERTDPGELELPTFVASSIAATRVFEKTPKRADCTGFWTAIERAALSGNAAGQRHMIVLAPDEIGGNPDDNLVATVHASRTTMQVVSTSANPVLREFCQRANGRFRQVKDASGIENAVSEAYLCLLARYEIRYQSPSADGASLKVRVHTPAGWGETTVELTG